MCGKKIGLVSDPCFAFDPIPMEEGWRREGGYFLKLSPNPPTLLFH